MRNPPILRTLVAATLALTGVDAGAADLCDDLSGQPIHFNVDWQTQVKPIINDLLGGVCTSCHNTGQSSGGLDLSDGGPQGDAIYEIVGPYARPGAARLSELFVKVNCGIPDSGSRMPLAGLPLDADEQGLIFDWIAQGALGEPDDPIFRDYIFSDSAESLRGFTLPPE
jgi:hypothetical protein